MKAFLLTLWIMSIVASMIDPAKIAQCEYEALNLGSQIADHFNLPVGNQDWEERVHQDFIIENLGFAPWTAKGIPHSNGLTLTGSNANEIARKGGWVGHDVDNSPYKILNHKWVYMFGDSTTRQIWASFAAPFQGNSFERNAKEWTRQYCNRQHPKRKNHPKGGNFDEEGWRGPCGVNEVTCYVSGYGDEGLLTFDWKHFPFEDYDEYIWGEKGPWSSKSERIPDILTVQVGMHTCWHGHPEGYYSHHLTEINKTMIDKHSRDIEKLVQSVYNATKRTNFSTSVVFVTSGATLVENSANMDECILKINRVVSNAAHKLGFPVLERGEIERRLLFKSFMSEKPFLLPDTHLPQPAQNIVATCLLKLLNCLNSTLAPSSFIGNDRRHSSGRVAQPLHSPP